MNAAPPITIGLPVYNGEPFFALALESILGQTFSDIAVVVSDNASTDGTEEVARAFAAKDARITYIRSPENRGAAWNYNRVFAECRSPYFKWAASDDVIAPTCVERCHEALHGALPGVVLVFPKTRKISADGSDLGELEDALDAREKTPHARLRHVVENVLWGNPTFGLLVSDALRRTRGHGNYPSADWVLLAELALQGELWQLPEPLFLRRMHEGTSRKANATPREIAQWFDPSNDGEESELTRVFVELLGAIKHAPIPRAERALCYGALVTSWSRRHVDVRGQLRSIVGGKRR